MVSLRNSTQSSFLIPPTPPSPSYTPTSKTAGSTWLGSQPSVRRARGTGGQLASATQVGAGERWCGKGTRASDAPGESSNPLGISGWDFDGVLDVTVAWSNRAAGAPNSSIRAAPWADVLIMAYQWKNPRSSESKRSLQGYGCSPSKGRAPTGKHQGAL